MKVLLLVEAPDSGLTPGWRGGIRWTGVAESVRKMVAQAYYDYKESAIRCHVLAVQAGEKHKNCLITFESAECTRWLYHDADLKECIHALAEAAADIHTRGPRPRVTITIEPQPQPELTRP